MRWVKLVAAALALTVLSGCSLALPEDEAVSRDAFVGFWVTYDRWENADKHVFNLDDKREQYLLTYRAGDTSDSYLTTQVGTAFGDVHHKIKDAEASEERILSATLYVIQDESAMYDTPAREIWLEGDVVQSLKDTIEPASGQADDGTAEPVDSNDITVYIPQEQIDAHGEELKCIADAAGYRLTLRTESPRVLRYAPVYQRADGSLYADDSANTVGGMIDGSGHTESTTQTETVNGITKTETISISVTVKVAERLSTVRLIEMSMANTPIRSTEIGREEAERMLEEDEAYIPAPDCAYVIVEETYADGDVSRTVYDRPVKDSGDTQISHSLRYPGADMFTAGVTLIIRF